MKYIIKILNLVGLLGTVAWFGHSPDIGKLLGAIALLATFLEQDRRGLFKLSEWDENLIKQFKTELPSDSDPILNLRDHDFSNSYWNKSFFKPLDQWIHKWGNAEFRFKDKGLNNKRDVFYQATHTLVFDMASETYPHDNIPEKNTLGYEDYRNTPQKEEIRRRLNDESTKAYEAYCDLIDEIRKKS